MFSVAVTSKLKATDVKRSPATATDRFRYIYDNHFRFAPYSEMLFRGEVARRHRILLVELQQHIFQPVPHS